MAEILDEFYTTGRIFGRDISFTLGQPRPYEPQPGDNETEKQIAEKKRLRRNQTFVLMGFAAILSYLAYTSFKT